MIKKIERPDWSRIVYSPKTADACCDDLDMWFDKHVKPINKMLDEAVEVGVQVLQDSEGYPIYTSVCPEASLHKALLINIQPIKQETCADVLRELVKWNNDLDSPIGVIELQDIYERAKAALGREK